MHVMLDTKMEKKNETSELSTSSGSFRMSYGTTKPSWLTSTLSDLDERMKRLTSKLPEGDNSDHSFKERADFYYEKRPQLIELLQDLYNGYVALSDKYTQSLLKQNHHSKQSSIVDDDFYFGQEYGSSLLIDSDIESSLSYHQTDPVIPLNNKDGDDIVTDLIMKNVELNVTIDEVTERERECNESSRKIEIQKSLLDVLESERLMLLNENAQLYAQVTNLEQEKRRLSSESLSVKRKATKMAKVLLKRRDEQRINMVRKIEDLQGKIQRLEKENECYEQLVNKDYYDKLVNTESYRHSVMKGHRVKAEKGKKKEVKGVREVDLHTCLARWNKWKFLTI